ncbi:Uncharacterised protein [Chlamydia trachomatis]|nr:Uncharacterised protein [Chlamydia trachomatis]
MLADPRLGVSLVTLLSKLNNRWGAREYILDSLSVDHGISERAVKTYTPEEFHHLVVPILADLVKEGAIYEHKKRYYLHE